MNNISKYLKQLGLFTSGMVAHHYSSKLLDYKENKEEYRLQEVRDLKLDEILQGIKQLNDKCDNPLVRKQIDKLESLKGNIDKEKLDFLHKQFKDAVETGKSVKESLEKFDKSVNKMDTDCTEILTEFTKDGDKMVSITNKIQKFLDEINKAGASGSTGSGYNNLLSNSSEDFYRYLDSMSLLEEASFLHVLIFITIILIVFNLFSVLLSNEIINYFNLESKYPRLYRFFKLRLRLQRYYFI